MEKESLKSAIKDNALWLGILLFVVVAAVLAYHREVSAPEGNKVMAATLPPVTASPSQAQGTAITDAPVLLPNATGLEHARELVAEYNDRLSKDPKAPDAPALYSAMGNLTLQRLGDYKEAARYFELLLANHSNWEGTVHIYPQLITCYEHLNDHENLAFTYKRMMAAFPPESPQYQYAKEHLGL